MPDFEVVSPYEPSGDQPEAIDTLVQGLENGIDEQVLLGVTGSGKTYTMAKVIERVQRPTLVLAHNKILAAQLCSEFKEFFPNNAVEYFVSSCLSPKWTLPSGKSWSGAGTRPWAAVRTGLSTRCKARKLLTA